MAVHSYLKAWDQCHLSYKFRYFTLDRFLAIPYKQVVEHGEHFALQHQSLCDTLRRTLIRKVLVDQTESIVTPRKKRASDLDSLTLNTKKLSIKDRVGIRRRLFASPRPVTDHRTLATCKERVSVKDRLGIRV